MKRMLWVLALAFVASAFAQQQPPTNPPYTTPPTFPDDREPGKRMPPDTKAPPPQGLSAAEVEQQIQSKLNSEPALENTKVGVKTSDKSVKLTGTVNTERQHDLALRIAQSYAGDRKIVDKIKVRGQAWETEEMLVKIREISLRSPIWCLLGDLAQKVAEIMRDRIEG